MGMFDAIEIYLSQLSLSRFFFQNQEEKPCDNIEPSDEHFATTFTCSLSDQIHIFK